MLPLLADFSTHLTIFFAVKKVSIKRTGELQFWPD
jgi:hypothetical protein